MAKKKGRQTVAFDNKISVCGYGSAVGRLEGEGPLGKGFTRVFEDEYLGEDSYEAAESMLLKNAIKFALESSGKNIENVDLAVVGDLLDQSMATTFAIKDLNLPHIGLYGACSTCALSLGTASVLIDSGAVTCVAAATSSHFCTAERQFRFPLEYGSKRTPNSQRTVTGAGAAVLQKGGGTALIKSATFGKIVDLDIHDANNMGAAMAPSAADTIKAHLKDTGSSPGDFDMILTGDLGKIGSKLLIELLERQNIDISAVHGDCGMMIYDTTEEDFAAGGSGCGCSGSVVCSHIFDKFSSGELKRVLFCGTGALLSPTSLNQGLSIPGICHAVEICSSGF